MVKLSNRLATTKVPGVGSGGLVTIAVGTLLVVLGMMFSSSQTVQPSSRLIMMGLPLNVESNAAHMKIWRQTLRDKCSAAKTVEDVTLVERDQLLGFKLPSLASSSSQQTTTSSNAPPPPPPPQPRSDMAVRVCKSVVMDFGANIGDTSGHVIDVGMISCDRNADLQTTTQASHFNVQSKQFELVKKRNILTAHIEKLLELQDKEAMLGPEDYCYYGVEGNPHFTERLREIEDYVMAIRPRPIQHMHFFTESVGAGEDGMTKLYLDTINTKENFWGSSIFKDHQDVRKSVGHGNDAETVAAPVMGYTIGTLMRKTLRAFDPLATEDEKKGGHLILKVDIEGGEYPLLDQAVSDGTLCEFIKMGNTADVFIEFHSARVTGKHEFLGQTKQMQATLIECGVTFRNLAAWWA